MEIDLTVPVSEAQYIIGKAEDEKAFTILYTARHRANQVRYFRLEVSEEAMLFLTIKYGKDRICKR